MLFFLLVLVRLSFQIEVEVVCISSSPFSGFISTLRGCIIIVVVIAVRPESIMWISSIGIEVSSVGYSSVIIPSAWMGVALIIIGVVVVIINIKTNFSLFFFNQSSFKVLDER